MMKPPPKRTLRREGVFKYIGAIEQLGEGRATFADTIERGAGNPGINSGLRRLSAVGRRRQFAGPIRPTLEASELYWIKRRRSAKNEGFAG